MRQKSKMTKTPRPWFLEGCKHTSLFKSKLREARSFVGDFFLLDQLHGWERQKAGSLS